MNAPLPKTWAKSMAKLVSQEEFSMRCPIGPLTAEFEAGELSTRTPTWIAR